MSGKTSKVLSQYALVMGERIDDVKKKYDKVAKKHRHTLLENMRAQIRLYWEFRGEKNK